MLPVYGCCVGTNRTSATVTPFKQSCPGKRGIQVSSWGGGNIQCHKLAESICAMWRCKLYVCFMHFDGDTICSYCVIAVLTCNSLIYDCVTSLHVFFWAMGVQLQFTVELRLRPKRSRYI